MYIGETGRNLQERSVEHKAAVKRGDTKNGVAIHACMGATTQGRFSLSPRPSMLRIFKCAWVENISSPTHYKCAHQTRNREGLGLRLR